MRKRLEAVVSVVQRRPSTALIPLLTFAVLTAASVIAVHFSAHHERLNNRHELLNRATVALFSLEEHLRLSIVAGLIVRDYLIDEPQPLTMEHISKWLPTWIEMGPPGTINTVLILCQGQIVHVHPPGPLFSPMVNQSWIPGGATPSVLPATVVRDIGSAVLLNQTVLTGVSRTPGGALVLGANIPVFSAATDVNESWGWDASADSSACERLRAALSSIVPQEATADMPCFDAAKQMKWWGVVSVTFEAHALFGGEVTELGKLEFDYQVRAKRSDPVVPSGTVEVLYETDGWSGCTADEEALSTHVTPSEEWELAACDENVDWVGWEAGLSAMVVIVSFILSFLVFVMLLSRAQHQMLLAALLPAPAISRLKQQLQELAAGVVNLDVANTPAEQLIDMLGNLLAGKHPSPQAVVELMNALRQQQDLYTPVDLSQRVRLATGMDSEAADALMSVLQPGLLAKACQETGNSSREPSTRPQHSLSAAMASVGGTLCADRGQASYAGTAVGDEGACHSCTGFPSLRDALALLVNSDAPRRSADLGDRHSVPSCTSTSPLPAVAEEEDKEGAGLMEVNGPLVTDGPSALDPDAADCQPTTNSTEGIAPDGLQVLPPSKGRPGSGGGQRGQQLLAAAAAAAPGAPVLDQVEMLLGRAVNSFTFDTWELAAATNNCALSCMAFYVFHTTGLIGHFNIDGRVLARFLQRIELGYRDNPYHNRTHAADVLHSVHVLLHRGNLLHGYTTPMLELCCYIAAVCHDYEHRGVTNDHLVNTRDELAIRYNDRSPHENHHLAASFGIMQTPGTDFLSHLDAAEWSRMRQTVIELVLATDMKQHFSINGQFTSVHRLSTADAVKAIVAAAAAGGAHRARGGRPAGGSHPASSTPLSKMSVRQPSGSSLSHKNSSNLYSSPSTDLRQTPPSPTRGRHAPTYGRASHSGAPVPSGAREHLPPLHTTGAILGAHSMPAAGMVVPLGHPAPLDESERMLSLQMLLKCADLGHATAPLHVHLQWVRCLEEEMFRQGDRERAMGMPLSPLCDRTKVGIAKSQTGFFEVVVLPLVSNFVNRFPAAMPILDGAVANLKHWQRETQALASLQATKPSQFSQLSHFSQLSQFAQVSQMSQVPSSQAPHCV